MKINIEKLKPYSNEELYGLLSSISEKIYKQYDYVLITKNDFDKLVMMAIEQSRKEINNNTNIAFDIIFSSNLKLIINSYISQLTQDIQKFSLIVSNYIDKNIKEANSTAHALTQFSKLTAFFNEINFIPPFDFCIELLKNNHLLESILKGIVSTNLSIIKSGGVDSISTDSILISFIEVYCMINNIKIESDDNFYKKFESSIDDIECTDDSVRTYLKEINKPLLSSEEEKQIAYRVLQGDAQAKTILIERNLRLVVKIAKKYIGCGLSFLDLIQEGNIGLMKAIDKYDVTKGYKFSTYASHWIRQTISKAIGDTSRNIRVPVHLYEEIIKYKKTFSLLAIELDREPSIQEMAKALKISVAKAIKIHDHIEDTVSLNYLIGLYNKTEIIDLVPTTSDPLEEIITAMIPKEMKKVLTTSGLNNREISILILKYGLCGEKVQTDQAIGKKFGISRERARQIEAVALKKIRQSTHIKDLAIYMQNPSQAINNIDTFRRLYSENGRNAIKKLNNRV